MRSKIYPAWWGAVGILFLLFVAMIVSIPYTFMHPDEGLSYQFTAGDFSRTMRMVKTDVHPPLWFASFWGWQQIFGDFEYVARIQAIFLSVVTLSLVYQLGRRWFDAARYGVYAMILLGANAFFFTHATEIRPYPLVMLSAAWSMLLFQRWLIRQTWSTAIGYGLSCALLMYVHYFLSFLIVVQVVYFVIRRPHRQLIKQGVFAGLLGFVLWLPWLPVLIAQVEHLRAINSGGPLGVQSTTHATTLREIERLLRFTTNDLLWLYMMLLVAGAIVLWRKSNYQLVLLWAIGVPGLAFVANLFLAVYTQRYFVYLTIGIALAISAAFVALPRRLQTIAFVAVALLSFVALPAQLPERTPYREVFQQMSAAAHPDDIVFFDHFRRRDDFLRWQYRHYLSADLQNNIVFDLDELLALGNVRRIWHVTNNARKSSVRNHFRAIESTRPLVGGFGDCRSSACLLARLLEGPPLREQVVFGDEVGYLGTDIDWIDTTRIDMRLWWRVDRQPTFDYSIGVHLLDENGRLIAQNDGAVHYFNVDMLPVSQLVPEQFYIDYRTLELPENVAPGRYELRLIVYQWWDGTRLLLPDGSDSLLVTQIDL